MGLRQIISLTRNRQETSGCRGNKGQTKEGGGKTKDRAEGKKREKSGDRGRVSVSWLLWDVLPHLKPLGSPLWWWWKQLVLNRSDACLLFCPLLASLPLPLRTLLPTLPLTLLPEFCSNSHSDHLPPAPAREEEGKFHSVTSGGGGGSPQEPLRGSPSVSQMIRCKPVPHSATQTQLCHCFNSRRTAPEYTWLTGLSVTQQPGWLPLSLTLSLSVSSHQTCRATFQLPPWSVPPALRAGLSQGGFSSG